MDDKDKRIAELEARIAAVRAAADAYKADPVDNNDRPRSWEKLDRLLDLASDASPPLAVVEGRVIIVKYPRLVAYLPQDFPVRHGDRLSVVVLPKPKEGT